jgi:Kinesin motor domain
VNCNIIPTRSDSFSVRVSVLEIYNEHLTDLLRDTSHTDSPATSSFAGNSASSGGTKLTMLETANGVVLPALLLMPLASEHEAYNVLFEAMSNRVVAEHNLNRRSSRSHVIYTFYLTATKLMSDLSPTPSPTKRDKTKARLGGREESDVDLVQSKLHLVGNHLASLFLLVSFSSLIDDSFLLP